MKRVMFFAMLASLLVFAGCEKEKDDPVVPIDPDVTDTTGTSDDPDIPSPLEGLFTVSEGRQVRFAKGNLEYDSIDGYRFAAHQYDYGGYFGWGTGSNPTLTSFYATDYPTFDDWGSHIDSGWRTLTSAEWKYVIFDRTEASAKRGAATVCGVHGMVLLPDSWSGGTFTASMSGWSTNVYDTSSWSDMEVAGAVFLPVAGYRYGTKMNNVGALGYYWSSTPYGEGDAYAMYFGNDCVSGDDYGHRDYGHSVRLVQDI